MKPNPGQAAKADSRAMQDAFEQVCERLSQAQRAIIAANQLHGFDLKLWAQSEMVGSYHALLCAAPFRKTGV